MSIKTQSIGALFVALVIILAVNPKVINNMYRTILGRLFLIYVVIFFSMNNITLGLLLTLVIITASNQFGSFVEGMENNTSPTIGEDNTDSTNDQIVLTKTEANKDKKISDIKTDIADKIDGIDKEDIKVAIMSKDSNQLPVIPKISETEEVKASTPGMLNPDASKLEGFSSYMPIY